LGKDRQGRKRQNTAEKPRCPVSVHRFLYALSIRQPQKPANCT
jgi:hypothetical protein